MALFLVVGAPESQGLAPPVGLSKRALCGSAYVAILPGLVELERQGSLRVGAIGLMAAGAAVILHVGVEPPMMQWIRRRTPRLRR